MKKFLFFLLTIGVVIGGIFLWKNSQKMSVEVKSIDQSVENMMSVQPEDFGLKKKSEDTEQLERRKIVKSFIEQKLTKDGNIITNYLPDASQQNVATGHDLLSESAGIYLLNLGLTDTQGRFDAFFQKTIDTFYDGKQFSYRVTAAGEKYQVNASLDDLRILRALITAKGMYKTDAYDQKIKEISKNFLSYSTNDGLMIDFYDEKSEEKSQDISLFYLDFKALGYIYQLNGIDQKYLQYQVNIVKEGYISDDFPFYQQKYNYEKQEYQSGDTINIIESLLTIRYLAELGEVEPASIEYVKENVIKGTLFNSYSLNGTPVDKTQSAASYAIAALIGYFAKDQELYNQAIAVLNNFQNTDPNNVLYGGFGDPITKEVYSFNNLMALLAYGI